MSSSLNLATAVPNVPLPSGTILQFFATSRSPEVLQLRLVGELDFGNVGELACAARRHLTPEHRTLRLHLARLRFCDCAGLRAVVDLHNQMLYRRGALHLVDLSPPVRRLLTLTGLDTALQLAT